MDIEAQKQEIIDNEHLRLLEIFHYLSGGLTILFSCFFIVHLTVMSFMLRHADEFTQRSGVEADVDPERFLGFFVFMFGTLIALGIVYGIAQILSGRFIKKRRYRIFSIIVALPNIIFIPYGTILSVLTLVVLDREGVKKIYASRCLTENT